MNYTLPYLFLLLLPLCLSAQNSWTEDQRNFTELADKLNCETAKFILETGRVITGQGCPLVEKSSCIIGEIIIDRMDFHTHTYFSESLLGKLRDCHFDRNMNIVRVIEEEKRIIRKDVTQSNFREKIETLKKVCIAQTRGTVGNSRESEKIIDRRLSGIIYNYTDLYYKNVSHAKIESISSQGHSLNKREKYLNIVAEGDSLAKIEPCKAFSKYIKAKKHATSKQIKELNLKLEKVERKLDEKIMLLEKANKLYIESQGKDKKKLQKAIVTMKQGNKVCSFEQDKQKLAVWEVEYEQLSGRIGFKIVTLFLSLFSFVIVILRKIKKTEENKVKTNQNGNKTERGKQLENERNQYKTKKEELKHFEPESTKETIITSFPKNSIQDLKVPNIFISYAGEDRLYLKELKKYLSPVLRNRNIENVWYDQDLIAGDDWDKTIQQNLEQSNVLIILISPDFLSSDKRYIWEKEMPKIMEKRSKGNALVIPVLLRDCLWTEESWLPKIQAILYNGKPLLSNSIEKDAAFLHAAREIARAIKSKFPE